MRILAISQCYPYPGRPGHCISQTHQMLALAREHDVRLNVAVPWRGRVLRTNEIDSGRSGGNERLTISYSTYWYPPKILQAQYGRFYLSSIRNNIRRILSNFSPNVIFACWAHPDGWAAARIARELGVPAVIKVIGSDVLILGKNRRRRKVVAEALSAADGVIAVSRDLADNVIKLGVDASRVRVVPEGIDVELFAPGDQSAARVALGAPADAKMALFVGNLLLSKGAAVLIEACAKMAARGVRFSCYLVGRGKDESKLRAMARSLGVADRVIFAGPCGQEKLVNWYRAADVVTLPSFSEGIPNVLREAMQCRRPFVATRLGGIPEISDPSVSRLVAPGDAGELATALEGMLISPPKVSESIPSRFNITWQRSAEMVSELLKSVTSAHREMSNVNIAELAVR
jgi:glycosyltransferase involved in cell wall biosynthesis